MLCCCHGCCHAGVCASPCVRRSDAAQWPGGGVAAYLARLQQEVLPWVAREYGASQDPADLVFAGSSFGGVAALAAGMSGGQGGQAGGSAPFGAVLVESPSMWIADEAFLKVNVAGWAATNLILCRQQVQDGVGHARTGATCAVVWCAAAAAPCLCGSCCCQAPDQHPPLTPFLLANA